MSIKVMTKVWESELPAEQKYVLLKLADHADDSGENVYPSIALVARRTGLSAQTVRRRIHEMVASGVLVLVAEERAQRPREYCIALGALDPYQPDRGAETAPLPNNEGSPTTGGRGALPLVVAEPSYNRQGTVKPREKEKRADWKRYKRSDESNDDRPPDAPIERWLIKEMSDHFGARIVQRQLERCDLFFVWRKIKQYVDDGDKSTLKDLLPRAQAEYQAEVREIVRYQDAACDSADTPEERDRAYQIAEMYRHIAVSGKAEYAAEYAAWEQENYPVVNGAQ